MNLIEIVRFRLLQCGNLMIRFESVVLLLTMHVFKDFEICTVSVCLYVHLKKGALSIKPLYLDHNSWLNEIFRICCVTRV